MTQAKGAAVDLPKILDEIETSLARASHDGKHDFRKLWLATVDANQQPEVRIVILRQFDRDARTLVAFTDRRTPKWSQLSENPSAQLNFWSSKASVQLRVDADVTLVDSGPVWDAARQQVPDYAKNDYAALRVPGETIDHPELGWQVADEWNFGVMQFQIRQLEWLKLSREGHRRARFCWTGSTWQMDWLQP